VLGGQIRGDVLGHLRFGHVGRGDTDRDDHACVHIGQDMPFVAIHQQGSGLAAVAHVRVLDTDPPVPGRALT